MKSNHIDYIDLVKGLGIILVVLGHGPFPCHFAIDVFHMPLFFFVAGMTFRCPSVEETGKFFIKKINRIFIPFIFWTILSFCIETLVGKLSPGAPFNGPLWFLQTLFTAFALYVPIREYFNGVRLHIVIALLYAISTIWYYYQSLAIAVPFSLTRAMAAVFYIHMGCYLSKRIQNQSRKQASVMMCIGLMVYIVGVFVSMSWFNINDVSFVGGQLLTYCPPLSMLTTFAGIMMMLSLSKYVNKVRGCNWLGQNSLVIMCVHFPIIERLNILFSSQPYYQSSVGRIVSVICIYVITFSLSIVLTSLCKRYIPRLTGYGNFISI